MPSSMENRSSLSTVNMTEGVDVNTQLSNGTDESIA